MQIQRFDREAVLGFVNPLTYLTPNGVEVLSVSGTLNTFPYSEIKTIQFVRDFAAEASQERRQFSNRPKMDGLWVRLRFRDDDCLEGVLPNDLLQLEPHGFTIIPPDFSYINQRIFIPKVALTELQVLGVVGSPLRSDKRKPKPPKAQIGLFE